MAKISDEYKDRGLKILAFPCNQFGGQEPGTHEEILEFTRTIDPDMPEKLIFFEKAEVNGANAREVFGFLKEALPSEDGTGGIRWNFGTCHTSSSFRFFRHPNGRSSEVVLQLKNSCKSLTFFLFFITAKFLVDHEGKPFKRFSPTHNPNDMKDDIEELLKRKEA